MSCPIELASGAREDAAERRSRRPRPTVEILHQRFDELQCAVLRRAARAGGAGVAQEMRAGRPRSLNLLAQRVERATVECDIVEGFPGERLRYAARIRAVPTKDDDARVVIFHGQAAIIFGLLRLANILASLQSV